MTGRIWSPLVAAALLAGWMLVPGAPRAEDEPEFPHGDFEGDCETCHSDEGWTPTVIDPKFRKKDHPFPFRQAHDIEDCRLCHRNLDFTKADPACVSCHADPHRGELGIDCALCHVPRTFIDRSRMQQRHQGTRFPLRGSHRALDCEDCHSLTPPGALQWVNTPSECVDCHEQAYLATVAPDHQALDFPRECDLCHVPTVWEAARFNHALTSEPCVTCHLPDYQSTADPRHDVVFFPTTCEDCHTPTRWENGVYLEHDAIFFPIYSGNHRGRWDNCSTCHFDSGDHSRFTCFNCHPHSDEAATTRRHEDEPGFSYESSACFACHPQGEADE